MSLAKPFLCSLPALAARIYRHAIRGSVLVLLCLTESGCFLRVVGPPEGHEEMESFPCTESYARPILDGALAGTSLVLAATADIDPDRLRWFATALVLGASASIRSDRVEECRAALGELARRTGEAVRSLGSARGPTGAWPAFRPPLLKP